VETKKIRIDKYLWCIRIFKTRSLAADACHAGKVKFNGLSVKASRTVGIGERYEIKTSSKKWLIEVSGLLHQRVNFEASLKYYVDLTPEKEKEEIHPTAFVFYTGKRKSKQGRPTKHDRRRLDNFLN